MKIKELRKDLKEKITTILFIVQLFLGACGSIILIIVDWRIFIGVFLFLWSNNLMLALKGKE
jgi:hypothetical protein